MAWQTAALRADGTNVALAHRMLSISLGPGVSGWMAGALAGAPIGGVFGVPAGMPGIIAGALFGTVAGALAGHTIGPPRSVVAIADDDVQDVAAFRTSARFSTPPLGSLRRSSVSGGRAALTAAVSCVGWLLIAMSVVFGTLAYVFSVDDVGDPNYYSSGPSAVLITLGAAVASAAAGIAIRIVFDARRPQYDSPEPLRVDRISFRSEAPPRS